MKPKIHGSALVTVVSVISALAFGAEIRQQWVTNVGVGEDGGPCEVAAATLVLHTVEGEAVAKHPISLEPEFFGIAVRPLVVEIPKPGSYTVQADFVGCDGVAFASEPIPFRVESVNETRSVQINGRGDKRSWRFEYFGITQELSGNGAFRVGSTEPLTLTSLSTLSIQPCRLMLGAQVQVLELVGDEWVDGKQFKFPDELLSLGPGEAVVLEVPRARVIRGKVKDEPDPTAYVLKISVLPPEGSFQHLVPVDNSALSRPFPGACDIYYVDFEWPKSADGD